MPGDHQPLPVLQGGLDAAASPALQAADAVQVDNSGLADPEIAQLSIPPLQLRQGEGRLIKGRGGIEKVCSSTLSQ